MNLIALAPADRLASELADQDNLFHVSDETLLTVSAVAFSLKLVHNDVLPVHDIASELALDPRLTDVDTDDLFAIAEFIVTGYND